MKNLNFIGVLVGVLLLGIVVGGFTAWAQFHEPATTLRSHHDDYSLGVYSYYTDSRGAEIQHGWSYEYRFDHGDHIEHRQRFERGKLVASGHSVESSSAERFDPPPMALRKTANEPRAPAGPISKLPADRNESGKLAAISSFAYIHDAKQFVGQYSQQISPNAKQALEFAQAVLSRRLGNELDGEFAIASAPWGYQVNFSSLRIWKNGVWEDLPEGFGEVFMDTTMTCIQIDRGP